LEGEAGAHAPLLINFPLSFPKHLHPPTHAV
jgi:hypothetical protein